MMEMQHRSLRGQWGDFLVSIYLPPILSPVSLICVLFLLLFLLLSYWCLWRSSSRSWNNGWIPTAACYRGGAGPIRSVFILYSIVTDDVSRLSGWLMADWHVIDSSLTEKWSAPFSATMELLKKWNRLRHHRCSTFVFSHFVFILFAPVW